MSTIIVAYKGRISPAKSKFPSRLRLRERRRAHRMARPTRNAAASAKPQAAKPLLGTSFPFPAPPRTLWPMLAVIDFRNPLFWALLIGWLMTVFLHEFA